MLKIILVLILIFHGVIHLLGFVKAFNYAEIKELKLPISKRLGLVWLLVSVFFIIAAIQYFLNFYYWWLTTIIAIIISQIIILTAWQDAKYGTVINVLIISMLALSKTL